MSHQKKKERERENNLKLTRGGKKDTLHTGKQYKNNNFLSEIMQTRKHWNINIFKMLKENERSAQQNYPPNMKIEKRHFKIEKQKEFVPQFFRLKEKDTR